ncbi:uncharacterized protein EI90DRAFT_2101972 [Cantharellus anzutake]|uniref:uncharacterized protein n=1 Tax=Cantharellus anzutake TaxID=1750568 RepID=UPI001907AD23|nr:uncharacterized protein EI90DRAFT_2101972 [Cantharellus anzutake]KAF8340713.1 hypothetical protein EI90DRAFT_2101972 [Cantharellus anzutake]
MSTRMESFASESLVTYLRCRCDTNEHPNVILAQHHLRAIDYMFKQSALLQLPLRAHVNICDKFGSNAMCSVRVDLSQARVKPSQTDAKLRVDYGAKARMLDHQNPIDGPKQRPEMTMEEADGGDETFLASIFFFSGFSHEPLHHTLGVQFRFT